MKKAKLFMMLALLVMGVSNTMGATKDYFVNYEREFLGKSLGNDNDPGYTIDGAPSGTTIKQFGGLTSTLGDGIENVGDRMIRVEGNTTNFESKVTTYIKANPITGYTTKVVLIENTIYICYIWNDVLSSSYVDENKIAQHEWTSGHFTFSDLYVKTNTKRLQNVIKLPDNQCAVRLNTYREASVTIPVQTTNTKNNKKYDVVAIQTHGMGENVVDRETAIGCDYPEYHSGYFEYSSKNDFYNDWSNSSLTTVTFEKTSKIRSIGDYAFCSCKVLKTIEIPQSVEYLGEACFSMCQGLKDGLTFEAKADGTLESKIKVIRNYTFNYCTGMTDLDLPDGIVVIEGQQAGAALQYMTSLTHLRLPNTLVAVGPHFLCDAGSLETVTIPAGVRYIDGAAFHGCEKLKTVYLLGPASALQASYTGSQSATTFDENETLCLNHMTNCVFITTQENIRGYVEDPNKVWQKIADNKDGHCSTDLYAVAVNDKGEAVRNEETGKLVYEKDEKNQYKKLTYSDGTTVAVPSTTSWGQTTASPCSNNWGNALTYFPDQKVQYTPGKWVTVILPKKYDRAELERKFGTDVMLAEMTGFNNPESSWVNGKLTYHLKFTEVKGDPEAHKPYMIKPGHIKASTDADYNSPYWVTLIACTEMGEDYRTERTKDHKIGIQATDKTWVNMYGRYENYQMLQWQFYFMNPLKNGVYNTACVFKRIVDPNEAPTIKPFRCYWRIYLEGEAQDAGAGAKSALFRFADDNETTGIEQVDSKINIEISGIYDMNGRKLDVKKEDLPKGIFIIDGKKVMVK